MNIFFVVDEHGMDRSGPLKTYEEAEVLASGAKGPRRVEKFFIERTPDGKPCAKCLDVLDKVFQFKADGLKRLKMVGMTPPTHG